MILLNKSGRAMLAFALRLPFSRTPHPRHYCFRTVQQKLVPGGWLAISNRRFASMKMIEVERKFRVSPETKSRLEQRSSSKGMIKFIDCYCCEELALEDMWLRQRNGAWELKIPVLPDRPKRLGTTVYRELVEPTVWDELSRLKVEIKGRRPYATLHTERTQLKCVWESREIEVVLDVCTTEDGFRYSVGELEILVARDSEVEDAATTLDHFAESLNLLGQSDANGKLIAYLKEKNETLYNALALKGLT